MFGLNKNNYFYFQNKLLYQCNFFLKISTGKFKTIIRLNSLKKLTHFIGGVRDYLLVDYLRDLHNICYQCITCIDNITTLHKKNIIYVSDKNGKNMVLLDKKFISSCLRISLY